MDDENPVPNPTTVAKNFSARPYQIDLFEQAITKNSIIYLPTGTGKTFIAVLLIKHFSADVVKDYKCGGKRTIFIVNTVALVNQQTVFLNRHTGLNCRGLSGEMQVDFWSKEQWMEEVEKNQVLVMTAQIFVNMLGIGVITLNKVNVLVFDECHRAVKDHPMRQIMQRFEDCSKYDLPRVLAMSASLLNANIKSTNVDDTIKELEVTFQSKVTTVDSLDQVAEFATNPRENIIDYESPQTINIEDIKSILMSAQIVLKGLDIPNANKNPASSNVFCPQSKTVKLNNLLTGVIEEIEEMGLYGGKICVLYHLIQCERIKRYADDQKLIFILDYIITQLCKTQKLLDDRLQNLSGKELIYRYSTPKIIKLLEVMKNFYELNQGKKFCCIIFVQKRFTAKVLYKLLEDLSKCDTDMEFITPEFIVGYNNDPYKNPGELECLAKWNRKALQRFKIGAKNCLVATDVVDEGVDIPSCTLVIRYFAPMDFRAYIQSKGRARHSTSHFVILAEKDTGYRSRYNNFKETEQCLRQKLHGNTDNRTLPSEAEIETLLYDYNIKPYKIIKRDGSVSVITEQAAVQLVNYYCACLVKSQFIMLTPAWVLKSKSIDQEKYMVELTLPPASPLRETIEGDWMDSVDLAKRSVAMKTCIALYKIGELTEDLKPRSPEDSVFDMDYLFPFMRGEKKEKTNMPGTKGKKRRYFIQYPIALQDAYPKIGSNVYLHIIRFKPSYAPPNDSRHYAFYKLFESDETFAILSSKILPEIPSFAIYVNVGPIQVSILFNKKCKLSLKNNEIESLKIFQYTIFEKCVENVKKFLHFDQSTRNNSFLVVPVNNDEIDWNVVNKVVKKTNNGYCGEVKSVKPSVPIVVENSIYDLALVYPTYRNPSVYIVTEVCIDKRAESSFPQDNFNTYVDYFENKHQLYIKYPKQPLLEVKQITKKINFIKPRSIKPNATQKKRAYESEDFEEHMVAELCERFDFPSVYWLKATTLPSVLHRVNQLLIATDLRMEIASDMNFSITPDPNKKCSILQADMNYTSEKKEQRSESDDDDDHDDDDNDNHNNNSDYDHVKCTNNKNEKFCQLEPNVELEYAVINQEMGISDNDLLDIERHPELANLLSIEEEKKKFSQLYQTLDEIKIQEAAKISTHRKALNVPVPLLKMLTSTINNYGPGPIEIMKSLTAKSSNDIFDLERSETLGDSFLKYAVSNYLFQQFPNFGEGLMTYLKGKIVGNLNLYYCGENKNLAGQMKTEEFIPSSFLLPAFTIPSEIKNRIYKEEIATSVLYEMSIPEDEKFSGPLTSETLENMHQKINKWKKSKLVSGMEHYCGFQVVSDKTVSDCVEALIGTYLMSSGITGALKILKWFQILPKNLDIERYLHPEIVNPQLGHGDINEHLPLAEKIENNIGYKFKNRAFLLQALTHASYIKNRITRSYERLEFLGDAILDFLLTAHIYEICDNLLPGELTDLRSALVNNITFACLAVKYELHTSLLMHAPKIFDLIDRFIRFQESRNYAVDDELLWTLLEEDDCKMSEHVDVPKILGDVFESIVGAIFLDSGMNLNLVWEVVYRLMKPEIDLFSKKVPKQPIRVIHETTGANPSFSKGRPIQGSDSIMVTLKITCNGKRELFHGFGSTKKLAKCAASKQALKYLRYKK